MRCWAWCWAVVAMCLPSLASAYEDDVHYGLSHWLAQSAGFSAEDAEVLARANVNFDHSGLSAITLVRQASCFLNNDKVLSQLIQRLHFPGEGQLPSEPSLRKVAPGSDAAKSQYRRILAVPATSREKDLREFGESLHPLQDSWSHQGMPDSPLSLVCDRTLSWGHPVARGAWFRHSADLSHLYINDAVEMASATYTALCEYRIARGWSTCEKAFQVLLPVMLPLLQAPSKVAKARWFREQGFTELRFLYAISVDGRGLDGAREPVDYSSASLNPVGTSRVAAMPNTPEARLMVTFFTEWMTGKDMHTVAKEFIGWDAFRDPLGQGDLRSIDLLSAAAHLMYWRVRDHGSLQQSLEGLHDWIMRPLTAIPGVILNGDLAYGSVPDALLPLDASGLPIATWVTQRKDGAMLWFGAARLRHAPNDLVIVTAAMVKGRPMVISINSVIEK